MLIIVKRPRAKTDLIDSWDYIADDSESRADAFLERIDQKFHMLAQHPSLGRSREELAKGLRRFPVGRYILTIPLDLHREGLGGVALYGVFRRGCTRYLRRPARP